MPDTRLDRRSLLLGLCGTVVGVLGLPRLASAQTKPTMIVYKDPSCACCQEWVNHATVHGYRVTVIKADMAAIKVKHNVPANLASCHTTLIDGYVVEGHVPASDIARLLKERPKGIIGLTIPGMPQSAPGMDVTPFQPFTVLTFNAKGQTTVYRRHTKPA
ncbi:MAG: DUF411 domain-containing protein [Acidobacteria bacterium]|nr:DUF411 domain-containing protein [Acidobacteriota bacterium]